MDPAGLLSDEAFARRIAHGLLREREGAEDLVQDAWLELLRRAPRHDASPRGYLATLLRRLTFRRRRGERRAAERERRAARGEAQPSAAEVVALAEIHQRTVAAVLALDEPYRSTVLLRFFEDLKPEEIARRERLPLQTVKTRLKRGLARLRQRLEEEGHDWRAEWALVLGHARRPSGTKLAHLGLVAGAAAVALVVWRAARPAERGALVGSSAVPALVPLADRAPEPAQPQGDVRVALSTPAAAPSAAAHPHLAGGVVDEGGAALADVELRLRLERFDGTEEIARATSDARGEFACDLAAWSALSEVARGLLGLELVAWRPGRARVTIPLELGADGFPLAPALVLGPGRAATALVLAPDGRPAGLIQALASLQRAEPGSPVRRLGYFADGEGRLIIPMEPGERLLELVVWDPGLGHAYRDEAALPAAAAAEGDRDLELGTLALARGGVLSGRVVHLDGSPVPALRFVTRWVEPDPESKGGGVRSRAAGERSELALGVPGQGGCTDAEGRFEVRGLPPGLHQFVSGTTVLADGAAFPADGPALELPFLRRRLLVEVTDPDGARLEEARVAVTPLAEAGPALPQRKLTWGRDLSAAFDVEPGAYAVLACAPGCAAEEQRLELDAGAYETRLVLALARAEARGVLELAPASGARDAWRVDLLAPLSRVPLPGLQDLVPDADGRIGALPLGEYAVRIDRRLPLAPESAPERAAPLEPVPVALDGGVAELAFTPLVAARLALTFGEPLAEPRPLFAEDLAGVGAGAARFAWLDGVIAPPHWRLELLRPGAGAAALRLPSLRPRAGTRVELSVPAEPVLLRVLLDGRPVLERELSPAPGVTLELSVPFPAPLPAAVPTDR